MKKKELVLLCAILSMYSCSTPQKISYFQDLQQIESKDYSVDMNSANYEVKILPSDLLSIIVTGKDPAAVAMFNLPVTSSTINPGETELSTTPVLQSYLVDVNGDIDFPTLGRIKVAGLSRRGISDLLKDKISKYAKDPIVNVQLLNFKVSVLGEVNNPGTKGTSNERMTIMDAISLSGDLSIYGNRENVLLVRENNGKKEFHRFNLTSTDIFKSPYFYLKQNDVIYVQPNQAKQNSSRIDSAKQFNLSVASTVTAAISVIASLCIALFLK
nr:polysaccharide biosynthesis/export family protein [uncultured Bacteroides sp.]